MPRYSSDRFSPGGFEPAHRDAGGYDHGRDDHVDAAGFPEAWSPETAPSVHRQWLEDQRVFDRALSRVDRDTDVNAVIAAARRPRRRGGYRIPNDWRMFAAALFIGMAMAAGAYLFFGDAVEPIGPVAASQPDVRRGPPLEVASVEKPRPDEPVPEPVAKSDSPEESASSVADGAADQDDEGDGNDAIAEDTSVGHEAPVVGLGSPRSARGGGTASRDDAPPKAKKVPAVVDTPTEIPSGPPKAFDRDGARSAMFAAAGRAAGCGVVDGPSGRGKVAVSVAPSGAVTSVSVGPPFAGSSTASCIAAAFRSVRLHPFTGGAVTLHKSFDIKAPRASKKKAEDREVVPPKRRAKSRRSRVTKKKKKKRPRRRNRSGRHRVNLD